MAKKSAQMPQLSPQQLALLQQKFSLQDRAFELAQQAVDRQLADRLRREQQARDFAQAQQEQAAQDAERAAQYSALQNVANIYAQQAKDIGGQYDVAAGDIESQRQNILQQLQDAVASGESGIGSAQEQLLRDLVATQAYQDVPLVELGQVANPLLPGLQAEGASTAGVQAQTEQDRQMAAQLAALTRGAVRQLNVGEQNYMTALRNAGALSAQQARAALAAGAAGQRMGIQSRFDELSSQIAQRRLQDIAAAQAQEASARGQAGAFAPIERPAAMPVPEEPAFDYAAELAKARAQAEADIRASMRGLITPPVAGTGATSGKKNKTGGKKTKTDPFSGAQYDPNELL